LYRNLKTKKMNNKKLSLIVAFVTSPVYVYVLVTFGVIPFLIITSFLAVVSIALYIIIKFAFSN